jgi:hypothetical protein
MIVSIAAAALAVQVSMIPGSAVAPVLPQAVQYRVPVHPPPCGHGWDLSARNGLCYPNGISGAAGPGRKLPARRPLSRAVWARRRPRCQGWPMLPERDGAAAISAGASTILRRTVRPTPASGPVLLSGLSYGRRSSATASATTATSEAMVYGFGSHPSGAYGSARPRVRASSCAVAKMQRMAKS